MKKRLLSMLMAMCLMATMVPAAFAADTDQPDTITLPNGEVREIPTVEFPDAPATLAEIDSSEVVEIDSVEKFFEINEIPTNWYSGKTFEITEDLDFTGYAEPAEWDGYIKYFYGNMIGKKADGSAPVISGIPNNRGFIYGIVGGTIENLTFNHKVNNSPAEDNKEKGSASFITFMPTRMTGATQHLTMKDIKVTGNISLTGADQSNYAPFLYAAPLGGLTMDGCVNEADITGSIYGSVFHGYYPLNVGAGAPYEFIDCVNKGNVTMQYAGMFFGNSSSMEGKVGREELYLTIKGCKNTGVIRGTSGAKYFAAPVSEFGNGMQAVENMIKPVESGEVREATTSPYAIEPVVLEGEGALCVGNELTGFEAELNGNDVTVTCPSDDSKIAYYVISVSTYTKLWNGSENTFDGSTGRYTVSQKINKGATTVAGQTFVPELKVYGFADWNVGVADSYISVDTTSGEETYLVYEYNDELYYHMNNQKPGAGFTGYISNSVENGKPAGGGANAAEIVTVAAYQADGTMLENITVLSPWM